MTKKEKNSPLGRLLRAEGQEPTQWEAVSVFINNEANRWVVREKGWGGRGIVDCGENGETLARFIAAAPRMFYQLRRILAMHECRNNGMFNGEAILSGSVAGEIESVLEKAGI